MKKRFTSIVLSSTLVSVLTLVACGHQYRNVTTGKSAGDVNTELDVAVKSLLGKSLTNNPTSSAFLKSLQADPNSKKYYFNGGTDPSTHKASAMGSVDAVMANRLLDYASVDTSGLSYVNGFFIVRPNASGTYDGALVVGYANTAIVKNAQDTADAKAKAAEEAAAAKKAATDSSTTPATTAAPNPTDDKSNSNQTAPATPSTPAQPQSTVAPVTQKQPTTTPVTTPTSNAVPQVSVKKMDQSSTDPELPTSEEIDPSTSAAVTPPTTTPAPAPAPAPVLNVDLNYIVYFADSTQGFSGSVSGQTFTIKMQGGDPAGTAQTITLVSQDAGGNSKNLKSTIQILILDSANAILGKINSLQQN